jgi:hypothetical protein
MIIFQSVVTGDNKYKFSNQANLTSFDVHNDSPYNVGVSFGVDTGIQNADYYTSAHSYLLGIGPLGSSQRSIGGVKFNGTIYVYTQTPAGGGTTNIASVPASQITVIGYPTNSNPINTASMSRWNNIGNPVQSIMGGATNVQNDNNVSGTSVVEATQTGAPGSNLSFLNSGSSFIAEWVGSVYTKLLQVLPGATNALLLGAASRAVEILGTLQVDGSGDSFLGGTTWFGATTPGPATAVIHASGTSEFSGNMQLDSTLTFANGASISSGSTVIVDFINQTDITIRAPNVGGSHQVIFYVGTTKVAHIDSSGNMVLKGSLTQNGTP